jgi:hypothetical protein
MHAVMCNVGAGFFDAAEKLIADRERYIMIPSRADNVRVTAEIGLPVCKALLAFGYESYVEAFELLYPIRHVIHRSGGSDAQRDVIQQTLVEAAIRADRRLEAQRLVGERLAIRPGSRFNWMKKSELEALWDGGSPGNHEASDS